MSDVLTSPSRLPRRLLRRRAGQYRAPDPRWEWPLGSVVFGFAGKKAIVQPPDLRLLGTVITGTSGAGKSRFTGNMLRQDFLELDGVSRGALLIDPHGTLAADFLNWYVTHGLDRVRPIRVLRAGDPLRLPHFNPLRRRPGVDPAVIAGAVTNAVFKAWGGADPTAMPQLRQTLKCSFTALVELGLPITEAANLLDISDATGLRAYAVRAITNPIARQFLRMLDELRVAERWAVVGSTLRRLNEFLLPERVRLIFSNPDVAIDWRQVMDDGEFVILDLSFDQGNLSEDEAQVIGSMILAELFLACRGRPETSIPFYVYIDECERYLTEDITKLFTEGRKFACSPILIHHNMGELRKAGEYIASLVMEASTKVIFRIEEDDDATYLARNVFRGQFDLQRPKERYNKPVLVGHKLDWLLNESDGTGTAFATGTTTTHGGSRSTSHSTTKSKATTRSESDTISEADTISESNTVSTSHTDSSTEGTSDSYSTSSSTSASDDGEDNSSTEGETETSGNTSAQGSADTYGTAHTTGRSHTDGRAHTTGIAETEGTAETQGTTAGTSWSTGTSRTTTASQQHTRGRSQTLRPELKIMPTQSYSLDELLYLASVRLGKLRQRECVVKIGIRPAVAMQTVHVKDGWARPEHIERVTEELAEATPYVASVEEALEAQREHERRLAALIAETPGEAAGAVAPPPLDEPKWS